LIVQSLDVGQESPLRAELLPGRYRAHLVDGSGGELARATIDVERSPLHVVLP
jgi:hypothetical protein